MASEYIETELYKGKIKVKFFPESHQYWINGARKSGVTTFIGIKDKSRALMSWKGQRIVDFLLKHLENGKLTEQLICVASYIDEIEKEEAADFGSKIHEWIEKYIKFKLKLAGYEEVPEMPEDKAVQNGVIAFLDWEKEHKVKFLSSERVVYSKKYDYMGTMDIEAMIGGDRVLVDIKSSNGLYNDVRMQTAAYVMADQEESGRKYKGRWAIRLSKYDEAEFIEREEKKKRIKQLIAQYRKRDFKDSPIPTFQVFEAKYLDDNKGMIEYDYEAFLSAMTLYKWNNDTDFYKEKFQK